MKPHNVKEKIMRKGFILAALCVLAAFLPLHRTIANEPLPAVAVVAEASLPPIFDTASAAQAHCPKDVVVWLNIPSGIYHYKGERWYGRTKHGAYACEKEAIKAGDRASLNGQ